MHRKQQLIDKVSEWLELELPRTCVSLDLYTSVRIELVSKRIVFTRKRAGKDTEIAMVYLDDSRQVTGMVLSNESESMSLMLFALEKAIETN